MNPTLYCSVASCEDRVWVMFGVVLIVFFVVGGCLALYNAIKGLFD